MATVIYKTIANIRRGVGTTLLRSSSKGECDLSNYYTKTELLAYHGAKVHYSNIVYDGLSVGKVYGTSIVQGWLRVTGSGAIRGIIRGMSIVTGYLYPVYGTGEAYFFIHSIEEDSFSNVSLVNDETTPGNSQLYGTNASGVKGWYDIPTSGTPDAHHLTHENGGSDEISVAGLSGVLADAQVPSAHNTTHENGGADEISVAGLSGVLADAQTPVAHDLTSSYHTDSSLTTGYFLKATGATTFAWAAHGLTYTDVGAAATSHVHGNITSAGAIGSTANLPVITTTSGVLTTGSYGLSFIGNGSAQYQIPVTSTTPFTPSWTTATNLLGSSGLNSLTYVSASFVKMTGANTFTLDTATYSSSTHAHGNITSAGAIGSTANLPVITTTSGALTTGSYGLSFIGVGSAQYQIAVTGTTPFTPTWTTATNLVGANGLNSLSYASLSFVKMSAAGTFSLDTATYASSTHAHGNITSAGAIGSTSNLPVITTTSGVLTTGSYGLSFIGVGSAQYQIPVTGGSPFTPAWTTATNLLGASGLNSLSYSSLSFVKMSASGTFTLDTNTYITGSHNHDSDYISIVSTPTAGNFPVLTAGGELNNSTYNNASFATAGHDHSGTYQPAHTNLTSLATLSYSSTSFVKMTGASTFALDTNTYSVSTHAHGNITSAGAIGSTATLPIITTTSGVLTTGTFGTGAGTFCQGNDSRLSDTRTPVAHDLTSAYHTDSGLTTGHFLKATGTTTFAWGAHGLTYTDVGAQQTHTNLTSLSALTYASVSFVKMTATGTFSLDTATYASGTHNHDSSYISIVSTPTTGNFPVLTSGGELNNSTYSSASFATAGHTHTAMVDYTGSPSDNYIAVFTDTNTIEGTSGLTYNGSTLYVSGTITSTGDMTATNFCQSSDERLKSNIAPFKACYMDISYKEFEMTADPGVKRYGVIAQELQKDHPELVREDENGMLSIAYIDLLIKEVAYLKRKIREYQDIFDVD